MIEKVKIVEVLGSCSTLVRGEGTERTSGVPWTRVRKSGFISPSSMDPVQYWKYVKDKKLAK
tara:strand:+ start:132 stop:317 length:186 start_codon:yes stop_codon:yes gene_type:complete